MMDHLEANFFDEIGTTRFVREKLENSEKE
jgi:hypothetical protein